LFPQRNFSEVQGRHADGEMNSRRCPICSRTQLTILRVLHRVAAVFFRCEICGHRFADTTQACKSDFQAAYDDSYSGFSEDPVFQWLARSQLQAVFQIRKSNGRILDVGCGNGAFLAEAKTFGYDVVGIDSSQAAVTLTKERQIPAVAGDFTKAEFSDHFDFITMWDVIEHLQDPRAFVERSLELLKPGGFLVIKTPFVGDPAFYATLGTGRLAGVFLQFPPHVQFFSKSSLNYLLNSTGYQLVEWLPAQQMRSKRPLSSVRAVAGRMLRFAVGLVSGNINLYVVAKK
jgi:2-polyprenyl-3-methyl-5-hydroxy-6-metoxy-1,4-benzoquinol methylase